jgi:hypothetical protein
MPIKTKQKDVGRPDIFSIIRDAYVNTDPSISIYKLDIPQTHIETLERWVFIDNLRSKDYPRKNTKEIFNIWKRKYGLSESQFYNDKKHCERLFGELAVINKDYEKKLAISSFDMLFSLAIARNDLKAASEALKQKCLLMGLYEKDIDAIAAGSGERTYNMVINMSLDGKKVAEKTIDISNLQAMGIKELKEISEAIDMPEADVKVMEKMINETK